jgi:hypothetical protein
VPERPVDPVPSHPNVPLRTAVLSVFAGVVVAGLSGAVIGWALAGIECTGACATWKGLGALAGAVVTSAGAAIVGVLALRAMSQWRHHHPD